MVEKVRAELGRRSYDIVIGSGILKDVGGALREFGFTRIAVISNPTVLGLYGALMESSLKAGGLDPVTVTVPDGEEYKDLRSMEHIWGELLKNKLDRKSAVVALGGGVVGDMGGFAASAYMRGIAYIQVPTTLLSQVDSSVGGKTGVNHPLGKNMIGAFYQPSLVWIDTDTLKSLPRREFTSGLAEVIKYGIITDADFFAYLEGNKEAVLALEENALVRIIRRSCKIKADIVSRDEREAGLRAMLNYGHTIGHAIEAASGYKGPLHGEAVAIGMHLEAKLAEAVLILDKSETSRIKRLLESYGLPSGLPEGLDGEAILRAMEIDKKALAGTLRFTLPERVGSARINEPVERPKILKAIGL